MASKMIQTKINEDLIKAQRQLAQSIVDDFVCKYYECEPEHADIYNIGDDISGVWGINDEFWQYADILLALDLNIPREVVFKWYYDHVDDITNLNLRHYYLAAQDKVKPEEEKTKSKEAKKCEN